MLTSSFWGVCFITPFVEGLKKKKKKHHGFSSHGRRLDWLYTGRRVQYLEREGHMCSSTRGWTCKANLVDAHTSCFLFVSLLCETLAISFHLYFGGVTPSTETGWEFQDRFSVG